MRTCEERLDAEPAWALRVGSDHFGGQSAGHKALEKITRRLEELRIPYAIAGGMALFVHGYRRFTQDVDVVVTADGLKLASGTTPGRRKDLGDVQELIRLLKLPADFAGQVHPSVREVFQQL